MVGVIFLRLRHAGYFWYIILTLLFDVAGMRYNTVEPNFIILCHTLFLTNVLFPIEVNLFD
jgi:hypothetical protein